MKALTLKEPWASWVAAGQKSIETRLWRTPHRGPLLICSGQSVDQDAVDYAGLRNWTVEIVKGRALATCYITDCRPMRPDDEEAARCPCEPGRWAWVLERIQRVPEPFHVRGQLGLFEVEIPTGRDNIVVLPP